MAWTVTKTTGMNKDEVFVTEADVYLDIDGEEECKARNDGVCGEGEHTVCTRSNAEISSGASDLCNDKREQHALAASNKDHPGNFCSLFGILHPVLADEELGPNSLGHSVPAAGIQHASHRKKTPFQEPNPYLTVTHCSTAHNDKNSSDEEIDVDTPYHGTLSGQTVSNKVSSSTVVPLVEQFKHLQQIAKKSTTKQIKKNPTSQQTARKSTTKQARNMRMTQSSAGRAKLAKSKARPKQDLLKIKIVYQKTTDPKVKPLGAVASVHSSLDVNLSTSSIKCAVESDLRDSDGTEDVEMVADGLSSDEDSLFLDVGSPNDEKYDPASLSSPKTAASLPTSLPCISSSEAAENEKSKPLSPARSKEPDKSFSSSLQNSLANRKRAVVTPKIAVRKPLASKDTHRCGQLIISKASPAASLQAHGQKRLPLPAEVQHSKSTEKSSVLGKFRAYSVNKRTPSESDNTGKPVSNNKSKVLSHSSNTEEDPTTKCNAQQQCKPVLRKSHFQEPSGKKTNDDMASEEQHSEEACSRPLVGSSSAASLNCSEMELKVSLVSLETAARPFDCSTCMKAFQEALVCPGAFRRLSRDKPFRCLKCSASFVHTDHLRKHENIHATSGTKPACLTNILLVPGTPFSNGVQNISGSSISKIVDFPVAAHLLPQVRVVRLDEERIESSATRNKCRECDKVFKNQGALDQHMTMHTVQGKTAKCQFCDRTFLNESGLNSHMQLSHGQPIMPSQAQDVGEISESLQSKGKLECKTCGKSFKRGGGLGRHMLVHNVLGKKPQLVNIFTCPLCDKTFCQKHSLREHMHFCHGHSLKPSMLDMTVEPFQCDICGQGFSSNLALRGHRNRSHSLLRTGLHRCGICPTRFSQLKSKIRHFRLCHTEYVTKKVGNKNSNMFRCKSCNQVFAKWNALWRHICFGQNRATQNAGSVLSESGITDEENLSQEGQHKQNQEIDASTAERFQCDQCPKNYTERRNLQRHIVMCHKKKHLRGKTKCLPGKTKLTASQSAECSGVYRCTLCLREYASRSSLKKHCYRFHKRLRQNLRQLQAGECSSLDFHCSRCHKDFQQQPSLVDHMEQHFRQKPKTTPIVKQTQQGCFVCKICKRRYRSKTTLNKHTRVSHPDHSVFSCTKCGMGFLYAKVYLAHIKSCQTQKDENCPYKCRRCNMSFSIAREWTKHMQMHYEGGNNSKNSHNKRSCSSAPKEVVVKNSQSAVSKSQKNPAKCNICSKYFKASYLAVHIKRFHSQSFHYKSDENGMGFFTAREWMAHADSHKNRMDEPSEERNRKLPPAEPLLVSKPSEHDADVSDISSVCCGENFNGVGELEQHMESHRLITKLPSGQSEETSRGACAQPWNTDEGQSQDGVADVYSKDAIPLPEGQQWGGQHPSLSSQPSEGSATQSQQPPIDLSPLQEPRQLGTAPPSEEEHFLNDVDMTEKGCHISSSAMQAKKTPILPKLSSPLDETGDRWIIGDPLVSAAEDQEMCNFHILGKPHAVGDVVESKMANGTDTMESSNEKHFLQEIHDLASLPLSDDGQLSSGLPSTDDLQFLNLPLSEDFEES